LRGGHDAVTIRVLITDDHKVVRRGLRGFLELDPALEVVGEAGNGEEALRMAHELRPDVVLMDLLMPVMDGIEATRQIRRRLPDVVLMDLLMPVMDGIEATRQIRRELPDVEVVALTSVLENASVTGAIKAGAIGYLLKTTDADELCEAIKAAAAGQVQLAPEAATRLMREVRAPESPEALTERETEVLKLVAHGKANKQIARELSIDESTIKSHVHSILSKLNVKSRTQAALHAVHVGLVSAEELGEEPR
jgi:DNA-binding NarL/FixJ family response regulator